jgi:hypothetical protein
MKNDANAVHVGQIFSLIYEYMETPPYMEGACYFLSAMSCILLREAGVETALCIGWIERPEIRLRDHRRLMYPHSWVEIHDRPFDIAIARPHPKYDVLAGSPILNGLDSDTGKAAVARYGVASDKSLGDTANANLNRTVGSYLSDCPWGSDYFWRNIEILGRRAGLDASARSLREAYASARWTLRTVPG